MQKLQWPQDAEEICSVIIDGFKARNTTYSPVSVSKRGGHHDVAYQLKLQHSVNLHAVDAGFDKLVQDGVVVLREPAWREQYPGRESAVWHASLA